MNRAGNKAIVLQANAGISKAYQAAHGQKAQPDRIAPFASSKSDIQMTSSTDLSKPGFR
ncbi:hypothetical protein B4098_0943 [Heyndrickxia coagulans]|jgi:hypothetical protein|uniref:Uncharacterized protein n=1 Tax=Heyndrickxia coagulans TaxID=1398 RepID=A0A150K8K6_HEYCO|nr:hypothetical protein B4098_0943 [Heyndrickxia coagulans]